MKKIYKAALPLLMCVFVLSSCSDFLNNHPKGVLIPQYFDDYAMLLNNMMLGYTSTNYPVFMTDDVVLTNASDVTPTFTYNLLEDYEKGCYTFEGGDIFPQDYIDGFYAGCYSDIYVYNAVAGNIMNVTDAEEADKERIKAEAVARRAFCFFQLVNVYAAAYDETTAATDYGIPVVLSEDINAPYVRNTVKEVYDQMVADLTYACEKLPAAVNYRTHMCKCGAYALLARVYLHMGKYDLCREAALKSLETNNNPGLTDYKLYNSSHTGSWDRITDADGNGMPYQYQNIESLFVEYASNDMSATVLVSDDLLDCFGRDLPEGAVDKRFELFYEKDSAMGYSQLYFPGHSTYISYYSPNTGVTMQEVYLMLAECEARIGSAGKATSYLDILRDSRIVGNRPLSAKDNADALRMTLEERRRETAFWGESRFVTLKRLNRIPDNAKSIVHDLDGTSYELPANDVRWVMPLPHNVITFNPDIPQYERK